ncbi:hypothetical protein FBU59_001435 [Linderina macrospora]|uniref:Uncharacterized protein n=1 Tax=Linderina macrospora TaxID=4868 RepID=A0ACC1JE35_9FUNG|nr:hypothetical protein FBU59_001435 [Linderina macrospora]
MPPPPNAEPSADSSGSEVDDFIQSMRITRNLTRVARQQTLKRRTTLRKEAKEPEKDQKELEKDIEEAERLASLLGRRGTRFDGKRPAPKVNHDLDETLDELFEDSEHVADYLLMSSNSAALSKTNDDEADDQLGSGDPVLKQNRIRDSMMAEVMQSTMPHQYTAEQDDLFDKIDQMHYDKSLTGSAEYLPMDGYEAEVGDEAGAQSKSADQQYSSPGQHVVGGKVGSNIDQILSIGGTAGSGGDDDDDGLMEALNRSNTWKLQSRVLIHERSEYGPALPEIADADEDELEKYIGPAPKPKVAEQSNDADSIVPDPVVNPADTSAQTLGSVIDAAESEEEFFKSVPGEGDGHISSDLQCSDSDDASDDSDFDRHLLAQQQSIRFSVANVSNSELDNCPTDPAEPAINGSQPQGQMPEATAESSEHAPLLLRSSDGAGGSTLRRNRRVVSKHRSRRGSGGAGGSVRARRASVLSDDGAELMPSPGGEAASARSSIVSDSHFGEMAPASYWTEQAQPTAQSDQAVVQPELEPSRRVRSLHATDKPLPKLPAASKHKSLNTSRADTSAVNQTSSIPGLALQAASAVSAAESLPSGQRVRNSMPVLGAHKQPPLSTPDRIQHTLAMRAAAEQLDDPVADSPTTLASGRVPPPLPVKARPLVPKIFVEEKLASHAAIDAAAERPSARSLFRAATSSATYQLQPSLSAGTVESFKHEGVSPPPSIYKSLSADQSAGWDGQANDAPAMTLEEWLRETDDKLPANNPVPKPAPIASDGKPVTYNIYQYQPVAAERQAARGTSTESDGSQQAATADSINLYHATPTALLTHSKSKTTP